MSAAQKHVKIVCFIILALALVSLVGGIFMIANSGSLDAEAKQTALSIGTVGIVDAVIDFVYVALGIRGANTPRKIGPFRVLSLISLVLYVISIGYVAVTNTASLLSISNLYNILGLVLVGYGFYESGKVKELAEK